MTDGTMAPLGNELELMTPDELKAWRREHKMTQVRLAQWLESSKRLIQNYEQDERGIPPYFWRVLRDIEAAVARGESPPPPREPKRRPTQGEPPNE